MKTLYLLRHAKADAGNKTLSDMDRPLSARGVEACPAIGSYLLAKRYEPDLALLSPSLRTRQTFEQVAQSLRPALPMRLVNKLYLASEEEIMRVVQGVPESVSSLLIVGHNPGMHRAALDFCASDDSPARHQLELKYPTGALAVLRFDCESWQAVGLGKGNLLDFTVPPSLMH